MSQQGFVETCGAREDGRRREERRRTRCLLTSLLSGSLGGGGGSGLRGHVERVKSRVGGEEGREEFEVKEVVRGKEEEETNAS